MTEVAEARAPIEPMKDRSAGLVVAGLVQIILGLICAVMVLLIAAASQLASATSGSTATGPQLVTGLLVYAIGAVLFISLGVGSIRARRWARALSIAVSAMWLAGGVVCVLMFAVVLPKTRELMNAPNAGAVIGCMVGLSIVGGVLLPLALFLFYRGEHVLATCERRDPKPRWTDRVPLPVLALVVVLALGAIVLIGSLSNPVLPIAGTVITGAPAVLTFLSLAVLSGFLAVRLYRLKESAWWTLVLLQVIGCAIFAFTLMRMDGSALAKAAGQPDLVRIYRDPLFIAVMIASWIGYFAFLMYLRRYFGRIVPRTRRDDDYSTLSR